MNKSSIIFIILIGNALISIIFLSSWLVFDFYESGFIPLILILAVSYFMPLIISGILITLHKTLTRNQKLGWLLYCVLTSHIGCIHFFLMYKKDIEVTIKEQDGGMEGDS